MGIWLLALLAGLVRERVAETTKDTCMEASIGWVLHCEEKGWPDPDRLIRGL